MPPLQTNDASPGAARLRLAGAALVAAVLAGCADRSAADRARALVVVVSGDTQGWIVPCGCASSQSGGLLRRGAYLDDLRRRADVIYLDAGGAPSGESEYDRVKFEAVLQGELALGIAGHNLGAAEARLGPDYLRRRMSDMNAPFVSCNVRDLSNALVAEPMRVVDVAGWRLAVMGVLSPSLAPKTVRVDAPRDAILDTIEQRPGAFDALVVLAYCGEEELIELANQLPEVDLIVGGPTSQSLPPRRVSGVFVASATNKGKFLAEFTASASDGWTARTVEMDDSWRDDPRQHENLRRYYDVLANLDFAADQTSFIDRLPAIVPDDFRIAGGDRCTGCHAQDCAHWDSSRHAHAWESLRQTGAHVDSYCQQCHTTGFGQHGGFVSARRSEKLVHVGCESCHGPSKAHADLPATPTGFGGQSRDRCLACHDRENSPRFEYEPYWAKIQHGAKAAIAAERESDLNQYEEDGP